ncbi:uncharacterized protein LOC129218407 [Uloborus diversus]|uniref:uncharacterized protein LOC129218407 n=1 Tax=Uloborus diversus TaxID=327109 RepID=UPI00240919FF|nr:uncharacterized protein LOC129218407 [Uloborus diversus]
MYWKAFLLILSLLVPQHMFSPVSSRSEDTEGFDDVKDLESLRNENAKSNTTEKMDHVDTTVAKDASPSPHPHPEGDEDPENELEPQANSRSAIFRHRGITQAKKSKYTGDKNIQMNGGYNKYGGIQYSPTDLAAYVFSTGDEEGVAVAVEELVREGMMGRTDAINYLQDVKQVLNYLKEQYEQQKKIQEFKNQMYSKQQIPQRFPNIPREQFMPQMLLNEKREQPKAPEFPPAAAPTTEAPNQIAIASTTEPKGITHSASTTVRPKLDSSTMESFKDESIKRRLSQQVENSYEFTFEVIYKLAKDMFAQSILKDDPVAEETLSSLVSFLESEVGNKRISPEMKEKVLEVVSHALVDSLREYERMMPQNQVPSIDEGSFYRHLAGLSGSPSQSGGMPEAYRKLSLGTHNDALSLASKANRPKSS